MTDQPEMLLRVRNLRSEFRTTGGSIVAVDDVSFDVAPGEVLSIVGESGSGKSVTALSILGLLDNAVGRVTGGEVWFGKTELRGLTPRAMRRIRGEQISMVFQEPMSALNPIFTVGEQIAEPLVVRGMNKREARERAVDLLDKVRVASPQKRVDEHPHQLSGGMRQRVMIAMALACNPKLLIADEPTTALDVTIQAQILELLQQLREETGMAMILITHDLGIVAQYADRAVVMYCGRVAEQASVKDLFASPRHPYTQGLLECIPKPGPVLERMRAIPGSVPPPREWIEGCRFATRCSHAQHACTASHRPLTEIVPGHSVACILAEEAGVQT
jgi:oligopeptide/dipeptide ABC transporter ATP-binding protein